MIADCLYDADFESGRVLPRDLDAVHVCFGNDSRALYAALTLRRLLRDARIPIVVRMEENAGLARALRSRDEDAGLVEGIRVVPMLELTCTADLLAPAVGTTTETQRTRR